MLSQMILRFIKAIKCTIKAIILSNGSSFYSLRRASNRLRLNPDKTSHSFGFGTRQQLTK